MTAAAFPDGALQPVLPLLTAGGRRSRGRKKVRARRWVKQLRDNSRKVRVRGALRIGDVFRRGRSKSKADWSSRSNQCVWLRLISVFASMLLLLLLLLLLHLIVPQKQYFPGCSAIHRWQPPRLKALCLIFLCYILFISSSDVREYIFAVGKSHICVVFAEAMMAQVSSVADVFPLNICAAYLSPSFLHICFLHFDTRTPQCPNTHSLTVSFLYCL